MMPWIKHKSNICFNRNEVIAFFGTRPGRPVRYRIETVRIASSHDQSAQRRLCHIMAAPPISLRPRECGFLASINQ
jgi:hypothetical protein